MAWRRRAIEVVRQIGRRGQVYQTSLSLPDARQTCHDKRIARRGTRWHWSNEVRDTPPTSDSSHQTRHQGSRAVQRCQARQRHAILSILLSILHKNDEGDLVIGDLQLHGVADRIHRVLQAEQKYYGKTITITRLD